MRTMMTAELPRTAATTTNQTRMRRILLPITSSHGLNASGVGKHRNVGIWLDMSPQNS